ncbi:MAG: response regulator [Spirochaetes bacterium]|nr:response regulator [Spirochaetota bacterium]
MRRSTEQTQRIFILFAIGMAGIMLVFSVIHAIAGDWLFLATNVWILLMVVLGLSLAVRGAVRSAAHVVLLYGAAGAAAAMLAGSHFYPASFPVTSFVIPFLMTYAILAGAFLARGSEVAAAMGITLVALVLHIFFSSRNGALSLVEAVSMLTFVVIAIAGAFALHITRTRLLAERDRAHEHAASRESLLSTMSHELRTPLSAITGLTDLLNKEADAARRTDYFEHLRGAVDHLGTLLDDILDFHKLSAGHLEVRNDTFPLEQTLNGVVSLFTPRAESMGLELRTAAKTCGHWIRGDQTRIRQVLHNLVDNALKFTDEGQVVITCSLSGDGEPVDTGVKSWLRFDVTDTGRGVRPEDHGCIFDIYARASGSYVKDMKGTGLGLPICRKIVEAMGGSIGFDSTPGQGSRFWFTVPTLRIPPQLVAIPSTNDDSETAPSLRVLLAEDEKANALVATRMLEALGHTVEVARDGSCALAKILAHDFDAALIDVHMPEMDGIEVIQRIRRLEAEQRNGHRRLPVICLTAYTGSTERELTMSAGADTVLHKPFGQEELGRVLGLYAGTNLVNSLH